MALSAAEKNRRKRERKKKEKEERRKLELEEKEAAKAGEDSKKEEEIEIEIEYVSEDLSKILNNNNNNNNNNNSNNNNATKSNSEDDADADVPPQTTSLSSSRPDGLPPIPGSELEQDKVSDSATSNNNDNKDSDNSIEEVLRRFHQRAAVVPSDSERSNKDGETNNDSNKAQGDQSSVVSDDYSSDDSDDENEPKMSKRKLRESIRPTVAELKRRVPRPDLVEAHDVTATDPDFLIALKGIPHTTPVPFHWGRKRKYLQGKRGLEKVPFKLPDFIIKTGITNVRDTAMEDEAKESAKQRNRGKVNPRMGSMDVDYKILYDAFFKYQTKPTDLTSWGDLYYEGKEMENSTDIKPGEPFSRALKIALGMTSNGGDGDEQQSNNDTPPPWLWNMQRYGPPPGHPKLKIPGLNAPLPNQNCQYGYHPGGWGKPPLDAYGRPLYGGNPLDPPGSGESGTSGRDHRELVTSDGKTVLRVEWGGLPVGDDYGPGGAAVSGHGDDDNDDDSDMEDSDSDMEDSSSDEDSGSEAGEQHKEEDDEGTTQSVLPPPQVSSGGIGDLRKQPAGDETPAPTLVVPPVKRLYQVLETGASASGAGTTPSGVFQSDVRYVVPGPATAASVPEGAESVLSKAMLPGSAESENTGISRKKRKHNPTGDNDDEDELEKNFKF